jgi:hypothetical protein
MRQSTFRLLSYMAILAFAANPARAEVNEVLANMAAEATTCAVYFGFAEKMLRGSSDTEEMAKRYHAASNGLFVWAYTLTKHSGLKLETVDATMKMEAQRMLRQIDHDMANASILVAEYGELCKEVEKEPEKRGPYWLDQLTRH